MHHTLQAVNSDPEKWVDYDPPRFMSHAERQSHWAQVDQDDDEEIDDF